MDETQLAGTDPLAFGSIQEAINKADPGATVFIGQGVFRENLWLEVPEVRLVGSGPASTHLEPGSPTDDPREDVSSVITLTSQDITIEGMRVEGGKRGLELEPGASAVIRDMEFLANQVGLYAEDPVDLQLEELLFQHNVESALRLTGTPGATIEGTSLVLEGNGDSTASVVGGIYSDLPLALQDVVLQDNTGLAASDLLSTAPLSARDVRMERPYRAGGAPRLVAHDSMKLESSTLIVNGAAAVHADCNGRSVSLVNTAIAVENSDQETPAIVSENCDTDFNHITVAHLSLTPAPLAMTLDADSENSVENSAFVGFEQAVGMDNSIPFESSFIGTLAEASLVRPFATAMNLYPQLDSPLIDGGLVSSVLYDMEGQPRPTGSAPDIGAFERH
ncbi:MAG: choice-of-anchor Q domain-containing protein [Myxococcota bacterium]|nr:choice-of-anchor Q domain-containing protein [Myxococcota bacterium]